mgnify:CR=1 FL=1
MAKIKLTKTAVDAAQPKTCDVELRDTIVPGFLCKVTPAGRKVFSKTGDMSKPLSEEARRLLTNAPRYGKPRLEACNFHL